MNQQTQQAPTRRRAGILTSLQSGLSQPTPPRISIKAQRFTLVDGAGVQVPVQMFDPQFGLYLDVVIIGANANKSKIFFENEYDPNVDDVPVCWSDNGIGPSSQSSKPQNPTCAGCPNNEWGSDVSKLSGKPTKLCQDKKKLALIVVNDPAQLVYQLQIPPATLKNLGVYGQALMTYSVPDEDKPGSTRPCDPADIVTRIYFNQKKQGELLFQPMGFWSQLAPYVGQLIERADASNVIDVITGANDVPWSGAGGAIAHQQAPQLAAPQAMPQMQAPPPPAQPVQQASQFQQPQFNQPHIQAPLPPQQNYGQTQPLPNVGQPPQPPAQQPAEGGRRKRGGARAGAGRPPQSQQQAPQPMQQPQPGFAPQQPASQPMHPTQMAQPSQGAPAFQMHAAQPAQQGNGGIPEAPAFLNATGNPQHPGFAPPQGGGAAPGFAPQAPNPQPQGAYGMQNGAAPPADLNAHLEAAFGAPLQPRPRG